MDSKEQLETIKKQTEAIAKLKKELKNICKEMAVSERLLKKRLFNGQ